MSHPLSSVSAGIVGRCGREFVEFFGNHVSASRHLVRAKPKSVNTREEVSWKLWENFWVEKLKTELNWQQNKQI